MGWVILAAYAALLVALATRRRAGDASGAFLVNNRESGAGAVALSMVASCVGASATLGAAGLAFRVGTPAFWWLGCGAVGLALMAALLARRVRESGARTLPEMAEAFLGPPSRRLISGVVVVAWTALVAAQLTALCRLLTGMTGLDGVAALAVATGLATVHSLGGQAAVIRLDRWHTPIIAGGLAVLLAALWRANPGWTAGIRLEAVNEDFTVRELGGYLLVIGGNYLVCPMLFGRFYSARDGAAARRGGWWASGGLVLFSALIVAVGLAGRGLVLGGTSPDGALLAGLAAALPGLPGLLVMGALVAAVVSSADSCLVTAGTVLGHDLLRRPRAGVLRLCVLAVSLAGAGIALLGHGILDYLFMAYDIYVGGVVMPVFIGLLLPKGWRVSPSFAAMAVALGGGLGLVAAMTGDTWWSAGGMAVAALLTGAGVRRLAAD